MPDITEILKRARPRERSVTLCLAGDEAAEVERLERQIAELSDTWQPESLGAKDPSEALAKRIRTQLGWDASVPAYRERVTLD